MKDKSKSRKKSKGSKGSNKIKNNAVPPVKATSSPLLALPPTREATRAKRRVASTSRPDVIILSDPDKAAKAVNRMERYNDDMLKKIHEGNTKAAGHGKVNNNERFNNEVNRIRAQAKAAAEAQAKAAAEAKARAASSKPNPSHASGPKPNTLPAPVYARASGPNPGNASAGVADAIAGSAKGMSKTSKWMLGIGAAGTLAAGGAMYYRNRNNRNQ